jgi:hypothetical protein
MSSSKRSFSSSRRLNTSIKVAALIAALGFVTVMLEQPRLTASPRTPIEQSLYSAGSAETPASVGRSEPAASGQTRLPASASEYLPAYFPSQFSPPNGAIEAQPPTF